MKYFHHHHHSGEGRFGGVLNGADSLSILIGGHGSSDAADILRGVGGVANIFGLGIAHKHNPIKKARKTRARRGTGFFR